MADSTRWLKDLEQQLRDAGGHFLGFSANQHRKWQIGPQMIVIPNAEIHARISRHSRKNTEGTVKRAIRKHGKWPELAEAHRAATLDRWADADRRLAEPEMLPPPAPPEPTPPAPPEPTPEPPKEEPMAAKKYRCGQCAKTFDTKHPLANHVRFHHPKPKAAKTDTPEPPAVTRDDRLVQMEGMVSLLFRRLESMATRLDAMEGAISMAGAALSSGTRRG